MAIFIDSFTLYTKVILKLCIVKENINEITHQVQFSSINIFTA